MVSLALSLPFGKGLLAVHSPTLARQELIPWVSADLHTQGLGHSSLWHQRLLCHVPGEPSQLFLPHKKLGKIQGHSEAGRCQLPLSELSPKCPSWGGTRAVSARVMELSQGTAGTRESRMKAGGRMNRLAAVGPAMQPISPQAHFFPPVPHRALPTHSCWHLNSAWWSFPHPWATHQENTAPWPLSLTPVSQSMPKIKDIRCNSQKTTRRKDSLKAPNTSSTVH